MCRTFNALIATLEEIVVGGEKAVQASGLLLQVKSFSFLLLLIIFDRILSYTKRLSDRLQIKASSAT